MRCAPVRISWVYLCWCAGVRKGNGKEGWIHPIHFATRTSGPVVRILFCANWVKRCGTQRSGDYWIVDNRNPPYKKKIGLHARSRVLYARPPFVGGAERCPISKKR